MLDLQRFQTLRPEARQVVHSLYEQSLNARTPFERFMLLWMSFNGWMNCTTDGDNDSAMITALTGDLHLIDAFECVVLNGPDAEAIHEFAEWWPIFDVKSIRRTVGFDGLYQHSYRDEFLEAHRLDRRIKRRPELWVSGQQPRWDDTLRAIYQVRCNLFHGDKSTSNPGDVEIVALAHRVLLAAIRGLNLYDGGPVSSENGRQGGRRSRRR